MARVATTCRHGVVPSCGACIRDAINDGVPLVADHVARREADDRRIEELVGRMIAKAVAAERERCAQIVESYIRSLGVDREQWRQRVNTSPLGGLDADAWGWMAKGAEHCAKLIRESNGSDTRGGG